MSQQVLIIPYSWTPMDFTPRYVDSETGEIEWGKKHYRAFIWGHDQCNDPVCWVVEDYLPYVYIRIEEQIENEDQWAPYILDAFHNNLKAYVKEKSSEPSGSYLKSLVKADKIIQGYEVVGKRPFFNWNTEMHTLYKLYFSLEMAAELCYDYLSRRKIHMPNGKKIIAKAYNNGVSDRIPTEEKLMFDQAIQRSAWLYASGNLVQHEGLTTLDKEYIVSYRTIKMVPDDYSKALGFPLPRTLTFDSETFSHIYTMFPKPTSLEDCMYAVGFRFRDFKSLKDKEPTIVNYIFVIWDKDLYGAFGEQDPKYGKVVFVYCRTESDLYTQMFSTIIQLDPSWIITYNGLGFDWEYLETRCGILGVKVPNMSRLRGWYKSQFVQKKWKKYDSRWPQYPGRIDVDMLYIIRLSMKFNSYSMKNVAATLLPKEAQKVELPYRDQFQYFGEKNFEGVSKIMDYLLGDIYVPEKLFDRLSIPVYLHVNASVMRVNPMDLYTSGQSDRSVNQTHYKVCQEGMYINSREITKSGKYIGAVVITPIAGHYQNVVTFDWNSLYPSRICVDNICYSTFIDEAAELLKPEHLRIKDEDCHIIEGEIPIVDKKTGQVIEVLKKRFRFIKSSIYKGIIPKIVTELNALRKKYKLEMAECGKKAAAIAVEIEEIKKNNPNPTPEIAEQLEKLDDEYTKWKSEEEIWNVKQNTVKTSANSMYGFMGMKTGKYSFIEGGMATTIGGRNSLDGTIKIVVDEFGAKLIYGDTDSVMATFPPGFIDESNWKSKANEIAKHISQKFGEGMTIVPENFFRFMVVKSKKHYAAVKTNPKKPGVIPTEEEILNPKNGLLYVKGFISVRGNSCGIVYNNFNPILVKLLLGKPIEEVFDYIHLMVLKVMRREYPLSDYVFCQKLGADYKNDSYEMAVFSDRLRQMGRSTKAGEEVEYVIMRTYGECLKGYKMQPPDVFLREENVLDTMYYVIHNLSNCIEELLCCIYDDSVLKPTVKKIIRPRKPTKAQKPTNKWHLELYIQRYVAKLHSNFAEVTNHIKCVGLVADSKSCINYIIDENSVIEKMKSKYGIDWHPGNDEVKTKEALKKTPIHRHDVWKH